MTYPRALRILALPLIAFPIVLPAQELPVEAESRAAAEWLWEVEEAPGAPWGLKSSVPAQPAQAAVPVVTMKIHTVERGDTLNSIARQWKTTSGEIRKANGLKTDLIQLGQKLKIPVAGPAPAPAPKPPPLVKPAPKPVLTETAAKRTETVRLQVFLDRRQFCPGRIDGLSGQFMRAALKRFKSVNPELADDAALAAAAQKEVPEAWVTYALREQDFAFVQNYQSGWPSMAAQSFLGYRSMWELVAERFHVSEDFLRLINPQLRDRLFQKGDSFIVPNVEPFVVEEVFPKRAALLSKKSLKVSAVIRQKELMLDLMRGEELLASFPITLGKPETRGKGDWTIAAEILRPSYHKRPRENDPPEARGKHFDLQPGPNNPVGVLWMSLKKPGSTSVSSQGLHGTYTPDTIGRATSLGCIRLANWDIVRAAKLLQPGSVLSWR